jgi:hypothetical protein
MSRASSPVEFGLVLSRGRSCASRLGRADIDAPSVVTVQAGSELVVGIPTRGKIECIGCGDAFDEKGWRAHTGAPPTKLRQLSGAREVNVTLRSPRLRCCGQTETLGCGCLPRTGWAVRGGGGDALVRLGLARVDLTIGAAESWMQQDPTSAAATLGTPSVGGARSALRALAAAAPYAVLDALELVYSPEMPPTIALSPAEFAVAAALFSLAGATCPSSCPCKGKCLRGIARALGRSI